MLKAGAADIKYLSAYLHDAFLFATDIHFADDEGILRIQIERQCFEKPQRTRWLFFIPVIRYSAVTSELRVYNVLSVEKDWVGKTARSDGFCHTLIEIDLGGDRFFLATDVLKLTATLSASHPVELEDVSLPTKQPKFTDLFTDVSRYSKWEHEIERLRVDV